MIAKLRHAVTSKPPTSNKMHDHKTINLHNVPMQTLLAFHPNFASMDSSINQWNTKLFVVRWVKLLNQFFYVPLWLTTLLSNLSSNLRCFFCVISFCFHFDFCVFTFFWTTCREFWKWLNAKRNGKKRRIWKWCQLVGFFAMELENPLENYLKNYYSPQDNSPVFIVSFKTLLSPQDNPPQDDSP